MWLLTQAHPPADGSKPTIFRLPRGKHNVGRKDQPVLIAEKSVSRNHGWLESDGKSLRVGDGGSKFGTCIDGTKVTEVSELKEGQVVRFGGREDGVADFRASQERILIALTACGEKHGAFRTQAITCGLDVIGETENWSQIPVACVSTADPAKNKPFSVACLRAAALGVKLVAPSYLEAWQGRSPLSATPPSPEDHVLPSAHLLQRVGATAAAALEGLRLVFVGDALEDVRDVIQGLGLKDTCVCISRAQASASALPDAIQNFAGKVTVVSMQAVFGPLKDAPRMDQEVELVAALVAGEPLASVAASTLVPPAPAPAPRRSPKRKAREEPSPPPKRARRRYTPAPDETDDGPAPPPANAPFDEAAATKDAKKMKVAELRAALEACGADTAGIKSVLVERLVGAWRAAAAPAAAEPSPPPSPEPSPEPSPAPKKSRRRGDDKDEAEPSPSPAPKRSRRRADSDEAAPSPPPKRKRAAPDEVEEDAPPPPDDDDDDDGEFDLAAAMDAPRAAPAPAPPIESPSPPPKRKRRAAEEEKESPAPEQRKKKRRPAEEEDEAPDPAPVRRKGPPPRAPRAQQRQQADTSGGGWLSVQAHGAAKNDAGGDVDAAAALAGQLAEEEPEEEEEALRPAKKRGGRGAAKPSKAEEARQLDAFAESGARAKVLDETYKDCVAPRAPTVTRDLVVARREPARTPAAQKKGPNFKKFRKNAVLVASDADRVSQQSLKKLAVAESETQHQLRRDAEALAKDKEKADETWDDEAAPKKRKPAVRARARR